MRTVWFKGIGIILFHLLVISSAMALQRPSPSSTVTTGYGWRIHPMKKIPTWHNGVG